MRQSHKLSIYTTTIVTPNHLFICATTKPPLTKINTTTEGGRMKLLREEEEDREMNKGKVITKRFGSSRCYLRKEETLFVVMAAGLITYKDCRKNHAAKIGGFAVDGCCEFMPAGEDGSPAAFLCAACHCHRNFHRKVVVVSSRETSSSDFSSTSIASK